MILKYLGLTNFRKFKYAEVEFPDGVVGVFGLNGVGKSTLFEAVAWAFYGSVAARTSSNEIKRVGASPSEVCRVVVEFIFNDNRYRVVREMAGKNLSPSATVTMNGKVVAQGAEAVTRFVQKLFGMDAKSFFTSLFAKQKELNALSVMPPGERKQLIMRMLGIDALDRVVRNIRSDKRGKKELVDQYTASLKDEVTGKPWRVVYEERVAEKRVEEEKIKKELSLKRERIAVLEKEFRLLQSERDAVRGEYENFQRKLDELRKKKEFFERKKGLEEEIRKLRESVERREGELRKLEKELRGYGKVAEEFERVESEIEKVSLTLSDLIRSIQREESKIEAIDGEIRRTRSKRDRIKSLGPSAPCPTCERLLGEHYGRLVERFDRELKENDETRRRFEENLRKYREEKERFERLRDALLRKRSHFVELRMKEKEMYTTIQVVKKELDREKRELLDRERRFVSMETVSFDEGFFKEVEEKTRACYGRYRERIGCVEEKQRELHAAKEDFRGKEGDLRLVRQQIQELMERIDEQKRMERRVLEEKRNLVNLSLLEEVMLAFRTDVISRVRPTVSVYASSLLETLTDGKYSELELDENYDILIYDGGSSYEVNRFSGGEEDLANLCIRLAISEMLTERAGGEFNLIILDEVFGSQDVNRRRNILSALNLLSNKFRQIFLITHIEEVKQFVTNAISVYEVEDGISRLKVE